MADLAKILDKAYENADFADLAGAPVSALQGVSESDAEHLKAAFGIDTIRELATNKFVLWAQAITSWPSSATEQSSQFSRFDINLAD